MTKSEHHTETTNWLNSLPEYAFSDPVKYANDVYTVGVFPIDDVSVEKRVATLLSGSVIDDRQLRLLACKWVRRFCSAEKYTAPESLVGIDVSERYASGLATEAELLAARDKSNEIAGEFDELGPHEYMISVAALVVYLCTLADAHDASMRVYSTLYHHGYKTERAALLADVLSLCSK